MKASKAAEQEANFLPASQIHTDTLLYKTSINTT